MSRSPIPPLPPEAFKVIVERGVDVVGLLDDRGSILYMSSSFELHFGHTPEQIIGTSVFDLLHPDDRALALLAFARVMGDEEQNAIIVRLHHKDETWRTVEVMGRYDDTLGQPTIILNTRDITQRQAMAEQIKRSEELFRAAFNATGAVCTITLLDSGKFVDMNDAWVEVTGWTREEGVGRSAADLNIWGSDENRSQIISTIRERGRLRQFPARIMRKDGSSRSLLVDAEIIGAGKERRMFISATDITDRELMEQQLRQSQRMEAVGQLTGGIAHDFNNMLTVILGQVDIAMGASGMDDDARNTLSAIRQASERGAALIRQLMIFSRRQTLHPQIVDVGQALQDLTTLIMGSLGSTIDVQLLVDDVKWRSNLDLGLLENAVLNLAFNARDAMPTGGTLTLQLEHCVLDELGAHHYELKPGNYLKLQVIDNGEGMEEVAASRAFEPFFTTKPVGQGTGLGLSMVFGFVKQSGGFIDIESAPLRGTTVTILIPATEERKAEQYEVEGEVGDVSGRCILLVEDDPSLRTMLRMMLDSVGCDVVESDGRDILNVLEDNPDLDLLLTDVVLSGPFQGPQIAQLVDSRYPGIAILYMSGYARDRLTSKDMLAEGSELLHKPFSRQELVERLAKLFAD